MHSEGTIFKSSEKLEFCIYYMGIAAGPEPSLCQELPMGRALFEIPIKINSHQGCLFRHLQGWHFPLECFGHLIIPLRRFSSHE